MKTLLCAALACTLLAALALTGCKKEKSNIPNFGFKTGPAYTSANASVPAGQSFMVGFTASQPENGDALKQIKGSYTVNNNANGIYGGYDFDLTAYPDMFSESVNLFAPDVPGTTHHYTFILSTTGTGTKSLKLSITAI